MIVDTPVLWRPLHALGRGGLESLCSRAVFGADSDACLNPAMP